MKIASCSVNFSENVEGFSELGSTTKVQGQASWLNFSLVVDKSLETFPP